MTERRGERRSVFLLVPAFAQVVEQVRCGSEHYYLGKIAALLAAHFPGAKSHTGHDLRNIDKRTPQV